MENNNSKYDYMHGSTAHKLNTMPERKRKKVRRVKRNPKLNVIEVTYKLSMIFVVAILFVGCATLMKFHANNLKLQRDIKLKTSELSEIEDNISCLELEIAEATDYDNIREVAINKLGMSEPKEYQKVYVELEKMDHVIVHNGYQKEKTISNIFLNKER